MMKKINETIGMIGTGFMGASILKGVLLKGVAEAGHLLVYDKDSGKSQSFARDQGLRAAESPAVLCRQSSVVLLAVKPQDLANVMDACREGLHETMILISILAGTPLDKIRRAAGCDLRLVRAMPNLGASVGEAVTALASSDTGALEMARRIFQGCGSVVELEEKYFDLVTAVSGSGPAYFFLLMELLVRAAVKEGLSEETAKVLAVQTAVGAARLAADTGEDPAALRRSVTSKGGTTEAALRVLEEKGVSEAIIQAVLAARDRGSELSQG